MKKSDIEKRLRFAKKQLKQRTGKQLARHGNETYKLKPRKD